MMNAEEHRNFIERLRKLCVGATVLDVRAPTPRGENYFTMVVSRPGEKRKTFTFGATELGCWIE